MHRSLPSYIPLKVDYTDLFDIMAFFTGDLDGRNAHDELAKQIADNGKDYATRFWRYADMEACASLELFVCTEARYRSSARNRFLPPCAGMGPRQLCVSPLFSLASTSLTRLPRST